MLKKVFFFSFSIILSSLSYGQISKDSLWNIWTDNTKPEPVKMEALAKIAWNVHLVSNPDSTYHYAKIGFDYASKLPDNYYIVHFKNIMAVGANNIGDLDLALKDYNEALDLAIEFNVKDKQRVIKANLASVYMEIGDYDSAIKTYLNILKQLDANFENISKTAYYKFGSVIRTSLATCLYEKGDYSNAIQQFHTGHKMLRIHQQTGGEDLYLVEMSSNIFNGLAKSHLKRNSIDSTFYYFKKAKEEIFKLAKGERLMASLLIDEGMALFESRDYNEAIVKISAAIEIQKKLGIEHQGKEGFKTLYEIHKKLGNESKALKNFEAWQAINALDKKADIAKKLQRSEFRRQIREDSLKQIEKDLILENIHKEELRKKEKSRNIFIGSGLFLLVMAIGLYSRMRFVRKAKKRIEKEKDRSENLLLNILPAEIAEELKEKGEASARNFDMVSILFTDFKGFTQASEKMSATDLVKEINVCFKAFDGIVEKYGIEKIKTIGDAYMCAGGLPVPNDFSTINTIKAGIEMQDFILKRIGERKALNLPAFEMRLGIHTGPIVAGIVGVKKFQYDIWGDTVNTASRMESHGEVGRVNISQTTYDLVKSNEDFSFESRGLINVKGKDDLEMYFVTYKS